MDFRKLESIQQAIPLVLRHLDAYVELAEHDFAIAKNAAASRLRMLMVFAVSGLIGLMLLCMTVIALTWDGQYRVLSIGLMAAFFVVVSISAAAVAFQERARPFESLRREWREDREWLRNLWATRNEPSPDAMPTIDREATWLQR